MVVQMVVQIVVQSMPFVFHVSSWQAPGGAFGGKLERACNGQETWMESTRNRFDTWGDTDGVGL